ncbi:uncharacterized membrane protein C3orf80 [Hypomesus transpacificus]|uniref:uncharacterized membrane protein C3orf80 n=1 Tax=Hypomesus transpacificus TaxID=137520 RepID=UPI001F07A9FF|nr:uncharacterized membrane protein C3orf80 [Hypomesus transpacificus]
MPRLSKTTCIFTAFLSGALISACQAAPSCGEVRCAEGQQCCPPTVTGNGSASPAVRCCKLPINIFFDNVGWVTRRFSGILILLLLFAMGYFIQQIICPRQRRPPNNDRPDDPSLFHVHATASQDSLLDRYSEYSLADFTSPNLPTYDEVKYLPTYEESMQDMHRDRSDDNLLAQDDGTAPDRGRAAGPGRARAGPGLRDERQDMLEMSGHSTRACRNSV